MCKCLHTHAGQCQPHVRCVDIRSFGLPVRTDFSTIHTVPATWSEIINRARTKVNIYLSSMSPAIKALANQIADLTPENLKELQAILAGKEEKLGEPWTPGPTDEFVYLNETGMPHKVSPHIHVTAEGLANFYNTFLTADSARLEAFRTRARRKMQRLALELEDYSKYAYPGRWTIRRGKGPTGYIADTTSHYPQAGAIYFQSQAKAEQAIKAMGDDIQYLFY